MNQGRIWCVVNPTVGLPLFLGSVAATSLIVHAAILTHVDWFGGYWDGSAKHVSMLSEPAVPAMTKSDAAFTMTVAPVAATSAQPASFVITVTPNAAATAPQTAEVATPLRTASTN